MIKYEIVERLAEFKANDTRAIEQGCAAYGEDIVQESFDTLEDALAKFQKYHTSVDYYKHTSGAYLYVREYVIEKCEYDEDGDPVGSNETLEYTEMKFNIVEKENCFVIATFENLADAENFIDEYDGEAEWELA